MPKKTSVGKRKDNVVKTVATAPLESSFDEVVRLIQQSHQRAYQAVNAELIDLYWRVGEYISRKLRSAEWGDGVVAQLAHYIQLHHPNIRGFTRASLFRMRQFYETYRADKKVASLLRQLPWTQHHLMILGRSRFPEEREFYMRMAIREHWRSRELDRQIKAALFERATLNPPKVAAALRQMHPAAETVFKDLHVLDFLQLQDNHSEADLHAGLLRNLGRFITELGRDFCFIGSEYPVQVGGRDFALDLLFFHRGLNCLVAIELKVDEFQPEHLGKLEFYLEALDRDVRKDHERPSIGMLLCAGKDTEVVEYALSRSVSPALIAEYQAMLPEKALLRAKLHEFYQRLAPPERGRAQGCPRHAREQSCGGKEKGGCEVISGRIFTGETWGRLRCHIGISSAPVRDPLRSQIVTATGGTHFKSSQTVTRSHAGEPLKSQIVLGYAGKARFVLIQRGQRPVKRLFSACRIAAPGRRAHAAWPRRAVSPPRAPPRHARPQPCPESAPPYRAHGPG